jgi:hypothetical protein
MANTNLSMPSARATGQYPPNRTTARRTRRVGFMVLFCLSFLRRGKQPTGYVDSSNTIPEGYGTGGKIKPELRGDLGKSKPGRAHIPFGPKNRQNTLATPQAARIAHEMKVPGLKQSGGGMSRYIIRPLQLLVLLISFSVTARADSFQVTFVGDLSGTAQFTTDGLCASRSAMAGLLTFTADIGTDTRPAAFDITDDNSSHFIIYGRSTNSLMSSRHD